jgi:hypothetical protein
MLEQAVANGYTEVSVAELNPHLASLRKDARWSELIANMKKSK